MNAEEMIVASYFSPQQPLGVAAADRRDRLLVEASTEATWPTGS